MRRNDLIEDNEGDKAVVTTLHIGGDFSIEYDCNPGKVVRFGSLWIPKFTNLSERVRELDAKEAALRAGASR